MSQRVKKPGKLDEAQGKGKRRRRRLSGSDGEEDGTRSGSNSGGNSSFPSIGGMWTPRHLNDLKVSSIYNRNSAEAPAELYRKDLISAMKLPDSEPLTPEEYWLITDPWKQEWEKGVQVPVNPESLPEPEVVVISPVNERSHDFRLPKKKYIRVTHDDFFNPDYHQLVSTAARAEKVCSYDLDDVDASWLSCANADRGMQKYPVISEFLMEQVIEELELQCWEQVQTMLKSQEGLGIEYDENVICDVCRSPESEEGNEMVFCDACNICVHQACYGITTIPSGQWLCRACTLNLKPAPPCMLCPNPGGAMKATKSGQKWAHVACAIWIPEVSIGCVEKMEPITKISAIPQSRWSLVCVICKDKTGACIQCSVKTCKTAYHVTCAFKSGLEMKPIIVDENAEDGIKLRSYCDKHSQNTKKEKRPNSGSEDDLEKKKARAMTAEERNQARAEKLQTIESEFYKYVKLQDVAQNLAVEMDIVHLIFNYWKLKRKSLNNRPLVPPRPETTQLLTQQQEQDLEQMKLFVQLRQDLERVRNLCYMVSRREKLSRTYFRLREQTFQKQIAILGDKSIELSTLASQERCAIVDANHGPSIYDQIYSQKGADCSLKDYDTLVSLIAGEGKKDRVINGVIKPKKSSAVGTYVNSGTNSYKRQFVNGARRKNLMGETSSLSESEASVSDNVVVTTRNMKLNPNAPARKPICLLDSESDGTNASSTLASVAKNVADKGNKTLKGRPRGSKRNQKVTKKSSSSDSDELELLVPNATGGNIGKPDAPIYSDSESEESSRKQTNSPVATKAAVKEFTRKSNKKDAQQGATNAKTKVLPISKGKAKGGRKKKGFEPTELIVPQREAAKKATESIRSVKQKKDLAGGVSEASPMVPELANSTSTPTSPSRSKDKEKDSNGKIEESTKEEPIASDKEKSKGKKRTDKGKPAVKKGTSKKPNKNGNIPRDDTILELSASESRDQYDFDGSNDGSKNVPTFVPQRQAAKKAAEHIRSGLSNIVATRLIIEDEMEAARKKTKGEKANISKKPLDSSPIGGSTKKPCKTRGKSSPGPEDIPEESSAEKTADNEATTVQSRAKKRTLSKGGDEARPGVKGVKKDLMSSNLVEESIKERDSDWPFLDRGSQSACRRSRERSSSSSSSSSSGSSSSDSSSSSRSSESSRSSSLASASPESKAVPRKTTPTIPSYPASTPAASISVTTRGCPGRKLKTSDRSPDGGLQHETTPGKKPPAKNRGPVKLRPGRNSVSGPHPSSAESRPQQPLTGRDLSGDSTRRSRQHKTSTSSRSSSSSSPSPTADAGVRKSTKSNKSSKEEGKRRAGESSEFGETEKSVKPTSEHEVPATSKSSPGSQTRAKAKALISSRNVSGILDLSSDSENDTKVSSETSHPETSKTKGKDVPSQSPSVTPNDSKTAKTLKGRKKGISNLSESDNEGADEKENSCLTLEPPNVEATTSNSKSKSQNQKQNAPAISILSPLTPSSENKEKEQSSISRSSDTEPELKRARLDSGTNCGQTQPPSQPQVSVSSSIGVPMHSSVSANLHAKSLFSPTRTGHESELIDFDSELYDLARSVSADYSHDDEGGVGGAGGSLPFSFSQSAFCRDDNGEDSAQATLNLVEKLRLQHARKSGCPRSSLDGSDVSMVEDVSKSPTSSVRQSQESKSDLPQQSNNSIVEAPTISRDENLFDEPSKSVGVVSAISPGRDKSIQGDERWVPPSKSPDRRDIHETSSTMVVKEAEKNLNVQQESPNRQDATLSILLAPINSQKDQILSHDKSLENKVESNSTNGQQSTNRIHQSHGKDREHNMGEGAIQTQISHEVEMTSTANECRRSSGESTYIPCATTTMSSLPSPTSVTPTTIISPGIKLPHGVQPTHFNPSGPSSTPTSVGFPIGPPHAPFLYPLAGSPSIANMVNSLTSISPNSAHSSFFRPRTQSTMSNRTPGMAQQPLTSSLSPGYPRPGFPSAHFMHTQQSQGHNEQQKSKENTVSPSSISPNIRSQRRSDFLEEKVISDSLVSAVTSGMPPLAKPSIASPSMILAASNVKNITPPPPPQSTVAQIIENVVNNHANNSNLGAQEILSAMLGMTSQSLSNAMSAISQVSKQKKLPNLSVSMVQSKSPISSVLSSTETDLRDSISNGRLTATSNNKVLDAQLLQTAKEKDYDINNREHLDGSGATNVTSVSPRGRGRRATTPRAAAKNDKILTACETNGVKGKGRNDRKSSNATSPARAKQSAPSRRGGGRGRGKGKVVVTRKDLAGTVYDIDFDEFEENVDEKLDLRMLRERRKSSDLHSESKVPKSDQITSPADIRSVTLEILSPKPRDVEIFRSSGSHQKVHNQSQPSLPPNENIVPILQPPLPGPVDMRTYSSGSMHTENLHEENKSGNVEFLPRKDPRVADIASIFSSGSEKGSIANELDDLDETLEALASARKSVPVSSSSRPGILSNQHLTSIQTASVSNQISNIESNSILISGRESIVGNFIEPDIKSSMGDFSRNQLKVKIKGPFLDANYGSHSIVGEAPGSSQHYPNSFHYPGGPSQMMSTPTNNTSNLRRMRKKELLRQYWTQDMNMDGSSCGLSHDAEISGMSANSMAHPINRSVITIPKAVASMAIIPTKDDYRLDGSSINDSPLGGSLSGMTKDALNAGLTTEKRKRKGMREMAALGIFPCDTPRERRRDRMDPNVSSSNFSAEMMGKKKAKANKRPVRSTFIPPTLAEPEMSSIINEKKGSGVKGLPMPATVSTNAISTVITAVNHPTPKLKIKFGDLSKGTSASGLISNAASNVLSDSDKEAPNKKAKGRPPKKRGIAEISTVATPSMEELKRESMKFREMVMQDFAVEERKEILQLKGTRHKHKKHKRKAGAMSSETDDGGKPKSPEVKVIADGSKLILRFGKGRQIKSVGGNEGNTDSIDSKDKVELNLNPNGKGGGIEVAEDLLAAENDSGFTGSSEGSSGSVSELTGASKERLHSDPQIKTEPNSSSINCDRSLPVTTNSSITSGTPTTDPMLLDPTSDLTPQSSCDIKPQTFSETSSFPKGNVNAHMPLRLKLSRCLEGYAFKNKQDSCAGEGVPPTSTPTKQSDSCEVR